MRDPRIHLVSNNNDPDPLGSNGHKSISATDDMREGHDLE